MQRGRSRLDIWEQNLPGGEHQRVLGEAARELREPWGLVRAWWADICQGQDGCSWRDDGAWDRWLHEVLLGACSHQDPSMVLPHTAGCARSSPGCCDTMLIKQLGGEVEGVSSNWLLCRFPVQTVSLKPKCHQSSAAEQPLRNLQVGRMHWFITAVILLVLGFICGGGVVHREPLLCFLGMNTGSGG